MDASALIMIGIILNYAVFSHDLYSLILMTPHVLTWISLKICINNEYSGNCVLLRTISDGTTFKEHNPHS